MNDMSMEDDLKAVVTIRKGGVEQRSRGGELRRIQFTVSEGFEVLRAKVSRLLDSPAFARLRRNDERIFFRKSTQHQFDVLDAANFEPMLRHRWKRISGGDRSRWDGDILGNFEFEFFVYCHLLVPPALPGIHRATAASIQLASDTLRQYEETNAVQFGPITRNHLSTALARQPDVTSFAMPNDNAARQAIALDAILVQSQEPSTEVADTNRRSASIRLRVNGLWVAHEVDVLDLRAALGLPAHDIFTEGIFHGYVPVQPPQEAVPDVDHQQEDNETDEQ